MFRHSRASHALALKSLDQLGKFSQRKPVHGCAAGFDLRRSFLFDRRDHDFVAVRAGRVEEQEWEGSVASDDAEFGVDGNRDMLDKCNGGASQTRARPSIRLANVPRLWHYERRATKRAALVDAFPLLWVQFS
jgi:hypothetical protein